MRFSQQTEFVTVVIPVYNGAAFLADCLHALFRSEFTPIEVIVVDDSSRDGSGGMAARAGAKVLSTENGPLGPAAARGLGVEHARGEIVVFIDADVLVHPETLGRFAEAFARNPTLSAAFGSYDNRPTARNFVSQWKNLSHHYFHQTGSRDAQTFWAGCGAVRRTVFRELGGFDLRYRGATIEDIEFGYRLRAAGHSVQLDPEIQATHGKRWTAWSAWKTDVFYRGIPWVRLILRSGSLPNDLNTSIGQRLSVLCGGLIAATLPLVLATSSITGAVAAFLTLLVVLSRYWFEPWSTKTLAWGWTCAIGITGCGIAAAIAAGLPLFALPLGANFAYGLVVRRHFPAAGSNASDLAFGLCLLLAVLAACSSGIALSPALAALLVLLVLLLALNSRYFEFLNRERGLDFTLAALPFQAMHFFAGAVSLAAGLTITALGVLRKGKAE